MESSRTSLCLTSPARRGSSAGVGRTVIRPDPELVTSLLDFSEEESGEEEEEADHEEGRARAAAWRKQCE